MIAVKTLYETDFNLWLEETAFLIKEGKLDRLDIENLLEEIEGMSRREKDAIESNLIRVLQHLIKWNYQCQKRSPSWAYTIIEHSRRLNKAFKNSPSLKRYFDDVFDEAFGVLGVVDSEIVWKANAFCVKAQNFGEHRVKGTHRDVFGFASTNDMANALGHFFGCLVGKGKR